MTYESTGEVRKPEPGDYYLTYPTLWTLARSVIFCEPDTGSLCDTPRVIMRPAEDK
jgi:hypothetical protein